jgi:hypothetical protein
MGPIRSGDHAQVFPMSNWTELDVRLYMDEEPSEVPSTRIARAPTDDLATEPAIEDRRGQEYF